MPKAKTNEMLEGMVDAIAGHLKKGQSIRTSGLDILQVNRPAPMGRNSAIGEAIKIKASKKIAFRAVEELKEAV